MEELSRGERQLSKMQRWSLNGERVRIYPDEIDGKTIGWAEYSLRELREMFWALHHVTELKTPAEGPQKELHSPAQSRCES